MRVWSDWANGTLDETEIGNTVPASRASGTRGGPPGEPDPAAGGGEVRASGEEPAGDAVVFVTEVSYPGGSEAVLARLARDLRQLGHDVSVVLAEEGWLGRRLQEAGVPLQTMDLWVGARWRAVRSALALRRLVKSQGAGVIVSWTFTTHVLAALATSGTGCVFMPNVRGLAYERATRMRSTLWRRLIAPRAAGIICVSAAVRDQLAGSVPDVSRKAVVIPNGVELGSRGAAGDRMQARSSLGVSEACFLVGTIGRVHRIKGHADLVMASAKLARGGSASFQIVIAGYPVDPWATELEALIQRLGVADRVRLLGHRQDVHDLLAAMDLFVLPSHSEGMPNALLVAMAAGKPVVATRVGGVPEIIRDGENGLLVPPNAPDALAAAIARLWADPPLAKLLGRTAQEDVAANHSWTQMVRVYEHLLLSAH